MVFVFLVAQIAAAMAPAIPQAVAMIAVAYIVREARPKDRKRKKRSKK